MTSLPELLKQSSAHAWLFVPTAILLGALHGLEPGHSKTMMAAFIVAIRGTVTQAALLGLSAALSHSMVVWVVALLGLYFGQQWGGEASEGYFQIGSAVFILAIAAWMAWRIWQDQNSEHVHSHDEAHEIATRVGLVTLEVFENGVPPCWRVRGKGANLPAAAVSVVTLRPDGARQVLWPQRATISRVSMKFPNRMPSRRS